MIMLMILIAFDGGERKPNLVLVSCVRFGCPVAIENKIFEIAVFLWLTQI